MANCINVLMTCGHPGSTNHTVELRPCANLLEDLLQLHSAADNAVIWIRPGDINTHEKR